MLARTTGEMQTDQAATSDQHGENEIHIKTKWQQQISTD